MATIIRPKNHDEWLEQRTFGIGASEVGTIMGVNKYQTPYQLWLRKKGDVVEDTENEALIWGHLLEDAVAKRYQMATGADIVKSSAEEIIYVDEKKPFMRISPDRLYHPNGAKHTKANLCLLECKTSLMPISEDDVPKSYFCQCQYQMHVSGIHHCTLAWMNLSNRTFGYKDFEYDKQFCDYMESKVEEFWTRYIVGDEEPPVETEDDARMRYPVSVVGSVKQATSGEVDMATELAAVKAKIKAIENCEEFAALKQRESELVASLKIAMEANENLVTADGDLLLTYKTAKSSSVFDEETAISRYPDLKDCYISKQGKRTMLLKIKA